MQHGSQSEHHVWYSPRLARAGTMGTGSSMPGVEVAFCGPYLAHWANPGLFIQPPDWSWTTHHSSTGPDKFKFDTPGIT